MSVFDADPLFLENIELIIREGTLHRNGGELSLRSLGKKLQELNEVIPNLRFWPPSNKMRKR